MLIQIHILVKGTVQGVGFRPFCAKLAKNYRLKGWVKNTSSGVELLIQGNPSQIGSFLQSLKKDLPPLAEITEIITLQKTTITNKELLTDFKILTSKKDQEISVLPPPDTATCKECIKEIKDPKNRRYRYPFTNCTNCGPRFTIIKSLPYDRKNTTMAEFKMCSLCQSEYQDITDRRYHAQPNACWDCGPHIWLTDNRGKKIKEKENALNYAIKLIRDGKILAIKGLGGFHLIADPKNKDSVNLLRQRKKRPKKPFALMVKDIETAHKLCIIDEDAEKLLSSPVAPILLLPKKNLKMWEYVAPDQNKWGIMLAYTPLHHLLLEELEVVIATSANISEEPIISSNNEALSKLFKIADYFLMHNRKIYAKCDDSVILPTKYNNTIIRRSRGFVPTPLNLNTKNLSSKNTILATGAEEKATFSFYKQNKIFISPYLGDLKSINTYNHYLSMLEHYKKIFELKPNLVACDMHPQYISTQLAKEVASKIKTQKIPFEVQHHHAHFCACLIENNYTDKAIGIILDGTGYGEDKTIWGGEILIGDIKQTKRIGHLKQFLLPGGESAIKKPWKIGVSLVYQVFNKIYKKEEILKILKILWPDIQERDLKICLQLIEKSIGFKTSSCGRLFDGVSSILGICNNLTYEGQAPIELENSSVRVTLTKLPKQAKPFIQNKNNKLIINWHPLIAYIIKERINKTTHKSLLGGIFHTALALSFYETTLKIKDTTNINSVALSGGVFFNKLFYETLYSLLNWHGFNVLTHKKLSPGDECISVGQAITTAFNFEND